MEGASLILKAVERLAPRLGAKVLRKPEGLELVSPTPMESEFFPAGFQRGFFLAPGQELKSVLFSLERPFFLMHFSTGPDKGPNLLASWNGWSRAPEENQGALSLRRVESVPEIQEYCALEPRERPLTGTLDPFTQHFLAVAKNGKAVGKLRLTDLDQGNFFLTRAAGEDLPALWRAASHWAALHQAQRILLPLPEGVQPKESEGFRLLLKVHVHGFS